MNASLEIKNLSQIVEKLLKEDKRYRDSDKKLCAKIWVIQYGGLERFKTVSAFDFIMEYLKEDTFLYSQESIGRARRKVQEENPELRGEKYQKKQEEQENVKKVLGYK